MGIDHGNDDKDDDDGKGADEDDDVEEVDVERTNSPPERLTLQRTGRPEDDDEFDRRTVREWTPLGRRPTRTVFRSDRESDQPERDEQ